MDGITGFVGKNGSGKSLAMVANVIAPSIDMGRAILSNTPIFAGSYDADKHWRDRDPHDQYVPLVSWRQLADPLGNTTIVLDEISSMFDSRESSRMPTQLLTRFQQLRKADNVIVWTAPGWERADLALRRGTLTAVLCTGHWPKKVEGKVWRQNRVFKWRYYDARKFDEFSVASAQSDQKGTIKAEYRQRYRRSRHEHQYLYDTLAPVNLLDHLDDSGRCIDCGGKRTPRKCDCVGAGATVGRGARQPLSIAEMVDRARFFISEREGESGDLVGAFDPSYEPPS